MTPAMLFATHTPNLPAFGRRLRRLRRSLGLKQSTLAEIAHVDQTTVSRWENGRILPDAQLQQQVLAALSDRGSNDQALRRLVEDAGSAVHLVDEASHICLAYSRPRARDWQVSQRAMLGVSLWPFATDEIRHAEAGLADTGWWDQQMPAPRRFVTSGAETGDIRISAGQITWERLYLSDGTPVRLVSGNQGAAPA